METIAVVAPVPSASDRMATTATSGVERRMRAPRRKSSQSEVVNPDPESALFSSWSRRLGPPLLACAATGVSATFSHGVTRRLHPRQERRTAFRQSNSHRAEHQNSDPLY